MEELIDSLVSLEDIPEDETFCSICKEPYDSEEHVAVKTSCQHIFGKSCLVEWINSGQQGTRCPICRGALWGMPASPWHPSYAEYMTPPSWNQLNMQLADDARDFANLSEVGLTRIQAIRHATPPQVVGHDHAQLVQQYRHTVQRVVQQFEIAAERYGHAESAEEEALIEMKTMIELDSQGRRDYAEAHLMDLHGERGMVDLVAEYEFANHYRHSTITHLHHVMIDIDTLERFCKGEEVPAEDYQPASLLFRYSGNPFWASDDELDDVDN